MQKVLFKRVTRNLVKNLPRYLALMFLIVVSLFVVISFAASADSVILGIEEISKEDNVEDGQFTLFVPLNQKEKKLIKEKKVEIEPMFYIDYLLENNSTLRVFRNRKKINLVRLVEGNYPIKDNELVLERRYAEVHDLHVNDTIPIANKDMKIVGIGTSGDYEATLKTMGDAAVTSDSFGVAFLNDNGYNSLMEKGGLRAQEYLYAYRLPEDGSFTSTDLKDLIQDFPFDSSSVKNEYFLEFYDNTIGQKDKLLDALSDLDTGIIELNDGLSELVDVQKNIPFNALGLSSYADGVKSAKEGSDELKDGYTNFYDESLPLIEDVFSKYEINNLEQFVEADSNPRINCAIDDALINKNSALFLGVVVMLLLAYIFAVFITHEIEKDNTVIGTLYSLGVTRKDLLFHYLQLPIVVTFLGGIIGLLIGMSDFACTLMLSSTMAYYSIPNLEFVKSPLLIVYATVMPPLMALVVNVLVINKKLNRPALSLLRNEQKSHKILTFKLGSKNKESKGNFINRFRIRQLVREYRSALTVVFGIFLAYIILCMGLNCYTFCHNINVKNTEDVCFNYMYTYKYPEKNVPENGTPVCAKTLSKDIYGYTMDINVLGISEVNPYFDLDLSNNNTEVVISDSVATRFNLKKGEDFILEDKTNKRTYAFRVKDIIKYSAGFYVFLRIDQMRELMSVDDNYFNMVISNEELDIPSGKLYNTLTREDIVESSKIFLNLMYSLIYILLGSSVLIFVFVMYLMMKVMIDRSSKSISLFRVFGFRAKEIRKLYLDGNFFVVSIGALIGLPLAKLIMDYAYPVFLVSNVAAGVYLQYHWWTYLVIYAVTIVFYLIINNSLVRHINKITPAELLRNRE